MIRCWIARRNLTAWLDGELPEPRTHRLRRHLGQCTGCALEAERLRAAVDWQRRTLPDLLLVGDVDTMSLRRRLQSALVAEGDSTFTPRLRLFRPLLLAGAALTAGLIFFLVSEAGGPSAVLIPLGVKSPPVAVTREAELFENYQLIQQLDALENFDTVESEPLDGDQASEQG